MLLLLWTVLALRLGATGAESDGAVEVKNETKESETVILEMKPSSDGLGMYVISFVGYYHIKMKLQVSLFNKLLSVASTTCSHKCDVNPKFDFQASSISAVSETTSRYDHMFVNRKAGSVDEWSFNVQSLQGIIVKDAIRLQRENTDFQVANHVYFEAITSTFPYWRSEAEGFLGLAPYTMNDEFPPNNREYNYLY